MSLAEKEKSLNLKYTEKTDRSNPDVLKNLTSSLFKLFEDIESNEKRLICSTYVSRFISEIIINEYGSRGAKIIFKSGQHEKVKIDDYDYDFIVRYKKAVAAS